jgi:serine/threonine protein kinase
VNKIETSREKLDVNQTYSLDSSFSYKKLQNKSIEVYYFGMPLGRGAYKNVYLGFEYDAETLFARSQIHRKQMRVSRFVALEALIRKRVEGIDSARLQFFNLSAYDEIGTYETYSNRSFFSFDLQKFWTFLKANQIESYEGSPYLQMNTVISHSFLQALDILHRGWIHFRDIKPDNVLLNYSDSGEISVALTDFDLSTDTHPHGGLVDYDPNGAPLFHSPEYIQEWRDSIGKNTRTFNNNLKNDVWAAGLTLWSLHQQNWVEINPALGINEDRDLWFDWLTKINTFDQVKSTFSMPFDTKTASDSFSFEFLIRWMLEPDPLKRPSASEALAKVIEIETKPNSKPEPYFSFQASSFLSDQLNPYAMKKQVKK